jgi:predicted kinase
MKNVTIYSGIPGSGKSTIAARRHPNGVFCSADDYFIKDGVYRFDADKIGDAHSWCLRQFLDALDYEKPDIVVDNTNTTPVEIAPYAALGIAFGYDVEVVTVTCDPHVAAMRNVHGVPRHVVEAMHKRLGHRHLPGWWKVSYIDNTH